MLEYIVSSTTVLLTTVAYLLYFWYTRKRPKGIPPGPISLPIIRGFLTMLLNMDTLPLAFTKLSKKYGRIFSLQKPNGRWLVVLNDAESLREAFLKKGADFAGRPDKHFPTLLKIQNPHHPVQGIIWGDYTEDWRRQRILSLSILRSLGFGRRKIEDKLSEEASFLMASIEKHKQPFDPHLCMNNAVANIICNLLFGERYDYDDEEFGQLQHALDVFFEMGPRAAAVDALWFTKYVPLIKNYLKQLKWSADVIHELCAKKLAARNNNPDSCDDFVGLYLKELKKNQGLEDRTFQLIQDFFAAGLETTSVTLVWSLYFMAKYQDVQEKVKEEIFEQVGRTQRPAFEDKEKLPYTNATILEILRLSTTSPFTAPHETMCDTELLGYKLPKGTEVWGNQWAVVRDPVAFPDPTELKPERFLDEDGAMVKNQNMIQFGLGRRSCLGEQLAKQELFIFFTHVVQKFHIYTPPGYDLPVPQGKYAITNKCPDYKICAVSRSLIPDVM